jgi:hypothetical protein
MRAEIIEDTYTLLPNDKHKNFTYSADMFKKGQVVDGEPRYIKGMRNGEPFIYRIFYTTDKQIIFLNKIKPETTMATEVKLGADASKPTVVNFKNYEYFSKLKLTLAIGLGAAGLFYAWKKGKNKAIWTIGGLAVGYGIAHFVDGSRKVEVKASK